MMIKQYILNKLLGNNEIVADKDEVLRLRAEILALQSKLKTVTPLSKGELTMKQLGSYIPSFKGLANESEDLKKEVGRACYEVTQSKGFAYLMDNLKQDQVNLYFFNDENSKSEEFVRGSINGIYVVDEQIKQFASTYKKYVLDTEEKYTKAT